MLFVNTRPLERASSLTQALNMPVLALPLLELVPCHGVYPYEQLIDTQVIVVVSPTAAILGLQGLKANQISLKDLQHIQWIAVGQATAKVLDAVGMTAHIPLVETSEGMLDLPILKNQAIKQIAFWRGKGGRQFMMHQLAQQGISILNFCLYERKLPQASECVFQNSLRQLEQEKNIIVCISSEASWLNWLSLCQKTPHLITKCLYLTLGDRLTKLIQKNSSLHVQKIVSLKPHVIQQAVKDVL